MLCRFDGNPGTYYSQFNFWGNFLLYLTGPVVPSLWLMYAHFQVFHEENRTKRLFLPLSVPFAANALITVFSLNFSWYYNIDAENIYHRGQYFWIPASITIGLILAAFLLIITNRSKIEKKHYLSLVFFAVPPFACIVLQLLFYEIPFMLNGLSLSLLIVFFTIQNRRMDTDYLTGAYNRKSLEAYMRKKIGASTENSTFSAILLDLNDFKRINDTFGHDMGDEALETSKVHVNATGAQLCDQRAERLAGKRTAEVGCGDELSADASVLRTRQGGRLDQRGDDSTIGTTDTGVEMAKTDVGKAIHRNAHEQRVVRAAKRKLAAAGGGGDHGRNFLAAHQGCPKLYERGGCHGRFVVAAISENGANEQRASEGRNRAGKPTDGGARQHRMLLKVRKR